VTIQRLCNRPHLLHLGMFYTLVKFEFDYM
jgi:hypothetical protein